MTLTDTAGITLGDPIPWFRATNIAGGGEDIHVSAGRWIVLAFLGSLAEAQAQTRLATLVQQAEWFTDDHMLIYVVLADPPQNMVPLLAMSGPVLRFIADYDGAIGAHYGAAKAPHDRARSDAARHRGYRLGPSGGPRRGCLTGLLHGPAVGGQLGGRALDGSGSDRAARVRFSSVRTSGRPLRKGRRHGFRIHGGPRAARRPTVAIHSKKRRQDMIIALPELRERIRERIVTRLLPAIELYFRFKATRMDRYIVSCYDSQIGGYFHRHRDNLNAGAEHRRFAVSLNLNGSYEGCDLIFPEFGRRTYRAPAGGAIVFSCGALHEVTPITQGQALCLHALSLQRSGSEDAPGEQCPPARGRNAVPRRSGSACIPNASHKAVETEWSYAAPALSINCPSARTVF